MLLSSGGAAGRPRQREAEAGGSGGEGDGSSGETASIGGEEGPSSQSCSRRRFLFTYVRIHMYIYDVFAM